MLRDCYCIPDEEGRYDDSKIEITDELTEILQQIDILLFTDKNEVLCLPGFGSNLKSLLFSTQYKESYVQELINQKINDFIYLEGRYTVNCNVKFVQWQNNVAMLLDLIVKDSKTNTSKTVEYLI